MDVIEGNVLFVDGSKIRADASIHNTWDKERCERHIKKIEEKIDMLIHNCEKEDAAEQGESSLVRLKENIQDKAAWINKIKDVLVDLEASGERSINSTDKDCVNGKSRQGTHAVYNMQSTVDGKHGLIVNTECVAQSNDYNQLDRQVKAAAETTGHKPKHVCSDAGYADIQDLKKIDPEINIVVPSKKQAQESKGVCPVGEFDRTKFVYDEVKDVYICPMGNRLRYIGCSQETAQKFYKAQGSQCRGCVHFGDPKLGKCTHCKTGRKIVRLMDEEFKEKLEENYAKPENQKIYALRKETVEHPFGHFKRNLGAGQFLLRGKDKVDAEAAVLAACFNLARLMTIFGIQGLISAFRNV